MIVKDAIPHHRLLIAVTVALAVLAVGFLQNRAAGQENAKESEQQVTKGGNLKALFLSERHQRRLAESRLHALQLAESLRHWNEGTTWEAWDVLNRTDPKMRHFEYGWVHTLFSWAQTAVWTESYIHNMVWSPNGKHIAVSLQNHTITIWDATTLKPVRTLMGHDSAVRYVSFDRDGRRVVSGDRRGGLKIWDVESGKVIRNLTGHTEWINSVEFSRDGKRIVSTSHDKTARVWDAETGNELRIFRGHERGVGCATFSPDDQWVASGGRLLRIWNSETGAERHAMQTSGRWVAAVAFSPKGDRVVTGHDSNSRIFAQLWDVESGEAVHSYSGFQYRVESVSFAPDGRTFAAGGNRDGVRICSAETGEEIRRLNNRRQIISSVAYAPSGNRLAASAADELRVWELDTPQTPINLQSTIRPSFAPNGNSFVTSNGNDINLRDSSMGKVSQTFSGHTERVNDAAFSPDGHHVASASDDGTIRVWEVSTGTTLLTMKGDDKKKEAVSWSPQGNWLVSYGGRRHRIWNAKTGEPMADLPPAETGAGGPAPRMTFAFSPDDQFYVCAEPDESIHVRDIRTGEKLVRLFGETRNLTSLAFSPDGTLIAGGFRFIWANREVLKVWHAETGGKLFAAKDMAQFWVPRAVFSPDSSRVMMAMGRTIRSWDARTGKNRHEMSGHITNGVFAEYFPDGQRIVSGSGDPRGDGRIRIWNTLVGEEVLSLDAGEADFVTVNHDGTRLLSAARKRTRTREVSHSVKLWHADGWKRESVD